MKKLPETVQSTHRDQFMAEELKATNDNALDYDFVPNFKGGGGGGGSSQRRHPSRSYYSGGGGGTSGHHTATSNCKLMRTVLRKERVGRVGVVVIAGKHCELFMVQNVRVQRLSRFSPSGGTAPATASRR